MDELARIFFHVRPGDAHRRFLSVHLDIQMAVFADRQIILGCLEILGQIRIIIVFPVKFAVPGDLAVQRQSRAHRKFKDLFIQHRQDPRKAEAYRAYIGIRLCAERGLAAAENLRGRAKFRMDFQSDDGFIFHTYMSPFGAVFVYSGWACSKA